MYGSSNNCDIISRRVKNIASQRHGGPISRTSGFGGFCTLFSSHSVSSVKALTSQQAHDSVGVVSYGADMATLRVCLGIGPLLSYLSPKAPGSTFLPSPLICCGRSSKAKRSRKERERERELSHMSVLLTHPTQKPYNSM